MTTIVFDLDDTLYDLMDPFQKTHEELYAMKTNVPCEHLFMASRHYSEFALFQWEKGLISKKEEFAYRIRKTYEEAGLFLTEEEISIFEKTYREYQNDISIMEDIKCILDNLKKNDIRRGILSNGKHDGQWKKITSLGLTEWFEPENVYISEDLPAGKPDKRAFLSVEKGMELDRKNTWYVGDTYDLDIAGAKDAGWHTIWFNHRKRKILEASKADYEVRTAEELEKILKVILKS